MICSAYKNLASVYQSEFQLNYDFPGSKCMRTIGVRVGLKVSYING